MITYEGQKYACINCIRGHRSSTCNHRDRPLLQVRRRGRPIGDGATRLAILNQTPCECIARGQECKCDRSGECVVVRTIDCNAPSERTISKRTLRLRTKSGTSVEDFDPSELKRELIGPSDSSKLEILDDSSGPESSEAESQEKVYAGKFVFVPVGNNLYRKELAADHRPRVGCCQSQSTSCCSSRIKPESPSSCCSSRSSSAAVQSADIGALSVSNQNSALDVDLDSSLETPPSNNYTRLNREATHHAPALIAPMYYNGHKPEELGFTQEEANEIWGDDGDFDFAAMCVMPGQCQCGDDCTCENCYTHGHGAFQNNNPML